MAEARKHVHDYRHWDEVYRTNAPESLPWELGRPRPQLVDLVDTGKIVPPGRVLDICCGLGTNSIYLAEVGFETSGIDIAPTAVTYAAKKAELAGVDIDFRVGDATQLPFEKASFGFVLDMGCFHHIEMPDRDGYLSGVQRVLAPGGKYFLICFSDGNGPAWNHFSEGQLRNLTADYFELLELGEFGSAEGDGRPRHFRTVLARRR